MYLVIVCVQHRNIIFASVHQDFYMTCMVLFYLYIIKFHFFLQSIFKNLAGSMCPILNIQSTRHGILYKSLQKNAQFMQIFLSKPF